MPRPNKIDHVLLDKMLAEGRTSKYCAEFFGVTPAAISQAKKNLGTYVTKHVVMEAAPKIVDRNINAVEQLQKINGYANELLDLVMRWNRGEPEALQVLESNVKRVKFGKDKAALDVKEVKLKDPRELALKAMGEIRHQLKLQLEIFQTLYDLEAVAEFQQEVLDTIAEVDPSVRIKIVNRLAQKRALRSAIKFH